MKIITCENKHFKFILDKARRKSENAQLSARQYRIVCIEEPFNESKYTDIFLYIIDYFK